MRLIQALAVLSTLLQNAIICACCMHMSQWTISTTEWGGGGGGGWFSYVDWHTGPVLHVMTAGPPPSPFRIVPQPFMLSDVSKVGRFTKEMSGDTGIKALSLISVV